MSSVTKHLHEWFYSPCGPWLLFSFLIYSQSVGLLGRVVSLLQGLYLNTGQHKHRKTRVHTKHPCPKWECNNACILEIIQCLETLEKQFVTSSFSVICI
jgi:hypothetical protein